MIWALAILLPSATVAALLIILVALDLLRALAKMVQRHVDERLERRLERGWRGDERRAAQRDRERAGYRPILTAEEREHRRAVRRDLAALQEAALRDHINFDLSSKRCRWFEGTAREIEALPVTEWDEPRMQSWWS